MTLALVGVGGWLAFSGGAEVIEVRASCGGEVRDDCAEAAAADECRSRRAILDNPDAFEVRITTYGGYESRADQEESENISAEEFWDQVRNNPDRFLDESRFQKVRRFYRMNCSRFLDQ